MSQNTSRGLAGVKRWVSLKGTKSTSKPHWGHLKAEDAGPRVRSSSSPRIGPYRRGWEMSPTSPPRRVGKSRPQSLFGIRCKHFRIRFPPVAGNSMPGASMVEFPLSFLASTSPPPEELSKGGVLLFRAAAGRAASLAAAAALAVAVAACLLSAAAVSAPATSM